MSQFIQPKSMPTSFGSDESQSQKWWLSSKTVQGVLLMIAPTIVAILNLFHVQIGNDEMNVIVDGIAGLFGVFGAIYAIIGRLTASQSLVLGSILGRVFKK
jgi:hypothetical protein